MDRKYMDKLRSYVVQYGLVDKVTLNDSWISEGEKIFLLSICLASAYVPVDEDSYGYPTLEAAHSGKATVTLRDSGGVSEFVSDGINGYVAEPSAESIAEVFDELWSNRSIAQRLGHAARERIDTLEIDWHRVVERLVA